MFTRCRVRGPSIVGLVTLSAIFLARPAAAQVILDLASVRPKINAALASHEIAGETYGRYSMSVGGATPSYYASLDAALSRTIMGEDLLTSITKTQRTDWIAHLHTFALPDGSYSDTYGHNVLHANGMTIGGLGTLGGKQKYPAGPLYAPFDTPAEAVNYLETQIDWVNQWGQSHKFWGGLAMYCQSSQCTTEWTATVFDWLDANVDPATGWWRLGQQPTDTNGLGGGAHIWPIFEHGGHAFPYPERVIDRILSMQAADGRFASMGSYLNLDALYGLRYMQSLATNYRPADIDQAVVKHSQWVAASLDGFLAANPSVHSLMAVVGDLGLMNQLAPTRCPDSTGVTWTDIFTDPRFYQTAAVEVFATEPPAPVGADRPAPYAYTVLADAPVGYWRLGETAPGGVADARGRPSLQGLHCGLDSGAGAGNVAQNGPRPDAGFPGLAPDNRAIHFAGEYDYAVVYDTPELDVTGALTLEAWIRLDEIPVGNEGIVSKYVGSGNQRSFGLYVDGQSADGMLAMSISPDGTYTNASVVCDDVALPLDTWLHVAGTYLPGQYMRLYINGSLATVLTTGVTESIFDSSAGLWIGCIYDSANPSSHFAGSIDEVAVYDRALSAAEILDHYRSAFAVYGDANFDGLVNQQDATILATYWGTTGADWSRGDFNGDGTVNAADASILAANWNIGESHVGRETPGVPEPSVPILLCLGCTCLAAGRSRSRC